MPLIKNFFVQSKQDKDSDNSLVREGFIRHAENLRTFINGVRGGAEANILGNTQVGTDHTSDMSGTPNICGRYYSKNLRIVFYMLGNEDGSHSKIIMHDKETDTSSVLVSSVGAPSVLNFRTDTFISGIHEKDGYLYWCNPVTVPMRCRINGESFSATVPTIEELSLKVKPPMFPPGILLQDSGEPPAQRENNIEEKPIAFAYRWRYFDGQYSDVSPFSEYAFMPKTFSYDYSAQSNPSMINAFNQVEVSFNTGSSLVEEVQLIFKVSGDDNEYIVDDYKKEDPAFAWGNNATESIVFDNDKAYKFLSELVLKNYSSNVPRFARRMKGMGSRLLMGDYTENFDLVDGDGNKVFMDYSLELVSNPNTTIDNGEVVPTNLPKKTVKSNRDVQIGIVYLGEFGRHSTVLVSPTNSIHVPVSTSGDENQIKVIINNKAPEWATHYRFFVKTNKGLYDNVLPILFYEDGGYRWIKLENADKSKVKEGDFLTVKSTSSGVVDRLVKTKVLEVEAKEQNFLQTDNDDQTEISEIAGLYFKIKPEGFKLDIDDLINYKLDTFDSSRNEYNNPIRGLADYISEAHFYGSGVNDATSNGGVGYVTGTYTASANTRQRFVVEIDGNGAPDTFRWSNDGGSTWVATGVGITGSAQTLENGVQITFGGTTLHTVGDQWVINARESFDVFGDDNAYGFFRVSKLQGEQSFGGNYDDDVIFPGARIELTYEEYGKGDDYFKIQNISSQRYDNIQEWFFGENIGDEIATQSGLTYATNIRFVRGNLFFDDNATQITQADNEGIMTMVIRSVENGTAVNRVKVRATSEVIQSDSPYPYCFETEGQTQVDELYYEVPETYVISNGLHRGSAARSDVNQTNNTPAQIKIPFWNAFSYGNGVELAKIRDEFSAIGIDNGVRALAVLNEEYKETRRKASITWSDVYAPNGTFNGLGSFLLSETNYIDLSEEDGAITGLLESQGNLQVLQEENALLLPFNRNIIEDGQGSQTIGLIRNVLDPRSAREYQGGKFGCQDPESIATDGFRTYFIDRERSSMVRLSIDGITVATKPYMNRWFIQAMKANNNVKFHATFDRVTDEYLVKLNPSSTGEIAIGFTSLNEQMVMSFHEDSKGIPLFYTFAPDMMVSAEDELYSWKDGVMWRHNVNPSRNSYYGVNYVSRLVVVANAMPGVEKTLNAIRLQGNATWDVDIQSELGAATVSREMFERKETHWFAAVGGDEKRGNGNEAIHGMGVYGIDNGVIQLGAGNVPVLLAVGDTLISETNENGWSGAGITITSINRTTGQVNISQNNPL